MKKSNTTAFLVLMLNKQDFVWHIAVMETLFDLRGFGESCCVISKSIYPVGKKKHYSTFPKSTRMHRGLHILIGRLMAARILQRINQINVARPILV